VPLAASEFADLRVERLAVRAPGGERRIQVGEVPAVGGLFGLRGLGRDGGAERHGNGERDAGAAVHPQVA